MAFTSHGHHIPGSIQDGTVPPAIARCGGPGLCAVCSRESGLWTEANRLQIAIEQEEMKVSAGHIPAPAARKYVPRKLDYTCIQFTGGAGIGFDIQNWILEHGEQGHYNAASKAEHIGDQILHEGWDENLSIRTSRGWQNANVGDWIILTPGGAFEIMIDPIFTAYFTPKE